MNFKVATWNVNSVTVRFSRLRNFLTRERPDVVCLQEIKCLEEKFPRDELKKLGYESRVWGQKTYNGVAILSRLPMTPISLELDGSLMEQARLIGAAIHGIQIFSLYVPNGQSVGTDKFQYKLQWLKSILQQVKSEKLPEGKSLLCGDYNIAPEDRDVHDPKQWKGKVLCSKEERALFQDFIKMGYTDTFRLYYEDSRFSWWDYRGGAFEQNQGLRIDHILASSKMVKLAKYCRIDKAERRGERPSDHAPVIAEFDC